jgi:hypothetical protein
VGLVGRTRQIGRRDGYGEWDTWGYLGINQGYWGVG